MELLLQQLQLELVVGLELREALIIDRAASELGLQARGVGGLREGFIARVGGAHGLTGGEGWGRGEDNEGCEKGAHEGNVRVDWGGYKAVRAAAPSTGS